MSDLSNNMPLDDILIELSRWGYVSLGFTWGKWQCEVRVPGYTMPAPIMAYRKASAETPRAACDLTLTLLEDWRECGAMAEHRELYLKNHRFLRDRFDRASIAERMGFNRIDDPGPELPERPLPRDPRI